MRINMHVNEYYESTCMRINITNACEMAIKAITTFNGSYCSLTITTFDGSYCSLTITTFKGSYC